MAMLFETVWRTGPFDNVLITGAYPTPLSTETALGCPPALSIHGLARI
jgi:hypothetical protein